MRRQEAQIYYWSTGILKFSQAYVASSLIGSQGYCLRMAVCGSWI